jgi:hypothetical protein
VITKLTVEVDRKETEVIRLASGLEVANRRIATLEGDMPSAAALDAIAGADTPSSTNVFLTAASTASLAPAVHTHAITDVTGLAAALSAKADFVHAHLIADVSGLQGYLDTIANKADLVHTHTMSEIVGLTAQMATKAETSDLLNKADLNHTHTGLLSDEQKAAVVNAPVWQASNDNPLITRGWYYYGAHALTFSSTSGPLNGGNLTTSEYGLVLKLRQGGQIYRVPCVWEGADPYPPIPYPS